ncbi:immunoglobulin superfamily member 5 isoform X1 [Gadus chalcogrammus]|uniref:immunoglobulin superfamily member 5 isoform X1 n=1 Tax=Gadus chalcogrammus TaxID=1042646 RepID=UPI0024C294A9|nr:immunoglobulin superfamily member 5 isoform X1 [Gadus chalcogrammus]
MDAMYKYMLAFLLLFGSGVGAQLSLDPLSAAVLRGSNVSFKANVTAEWKVMTWDVGKLLVLTILSTDGVIESLPRYVARNISTGSAGGAWEFSIVDVQKSDSGPVVCTIQGRIGSKTATLQVQERGTITISSGNQTVNQDQQAEFRCELSGWFPAPEVSWLLDGQPASTSLYNTTFQEQGSTFNGTSVLTMKAVRDATVQCRAFLSAATGLQTVYLSVVPTPTDWTVLIAVVLSFSIAALLVLLIILIFFCIRRKKEKEKELREGRLQGRAVAARPRNGTINLGFAMDDRTSTDQGPARTHARMTPSVERDLSQNDDPRIYQIPPVDNPARNGANDFPGGENVMEYRKHRHLTHV